MERQDHNIVSEATTESGDASSVAFDQTYVNALVCCDWANETESGKHNLIGIFDRLFVREFPGRTPPFFVFIRVSGRAPKTVLLEVIGPTGKKLAKMNVEVGNPASDSIEPGAIQVLSRMRLLAELPGVYRLDVFADEKLIGRAPLIVELQENHGDDNQALSGIPEPDQE